MPTSLQERTITRESVAQDISSWSKEDLRKIWAFINPLMNRVGRDENKNTLLHEYLSTEEKPDHFLKLLKLLELEPETLTFCQINFIWLALRSKLFESN